MIDEKERFMLHVRVEGEHWIWTGAPCKGYGRIRDPKTWKHVWAHRYSYELFVGPVPSDKLVLHKHEGLSMCVNPACLKLGDYKENANDYIVAGGLYGGKLSAAEVSFIRSSDYSRKDLAKMFNVSQSAISRVKRGVTWKTTQ